MEFKHLSEGCIIKVRTASSFFTDRDFVLADLMTKQVKITRAKIFNAFFFFFLHQLLLKKEFPNYTWHQAFPVRKRTEKEFPLDSRHSCPPAIFHEVLDHPSFTCINLGTKTISWQVLGTESCEHTWLGSRKSPYLENRGSYKACLLVINLTHFLPRFWSTAISSVRCSALTSSRRGEV